MTNDKPINKLPCIAYNCNERRSRASYCTGHWEDKQNGVPVVLKEDARHEQIINELKLINTNLEKLANPLDPLSAFESNYGSYTGSIRFR